MTPIASLSGARPPLAAPQPMLNPERKTACPLTRHEEMVFFGTEKLVATPLLSKAYWMAHPESARDMLFEISNDPQDPLAILAAQHVKFLSFGSVQHNRAPPLDCILVLGHELAADGSPSNRLTARLNSALQCLQNHPASHILVSGGHPKSGATEARVMKDWLVSKGAPQASITLEGASTDTVDNIARSMEILRTLNARSIKLVTDNDHMPRAIALFSTHIAMSGSSMAMLNHATSDDFANAPIYEQFLLMKDIGRLTNFWSYRFDIQSIIAKHPIASPQGS